MDQIDVVIYNVDLLFGGGDVYNVVPALARELSRELVPPRDYRRDPFGQMAAAAWRQARTSLSGNHGQSLRLCHLFHQRTLHQVGGIQKRRLAGGKIK